MTVEKIEFCADFKVQCAISLKQFRWKAYLASFSAHFYDAYATFEMMNFPTLLFQVHFLLNLGPKWAFDTKNRLIFMKLWSNIAKIFLANFSQKFLERPQKGKMARMHERNRERNLRISCMRVTSEARCQAKKWQGFHFDKNGPPWLGRA